MSIKQETINKLWVILAEASEQMSTEIIDNAEKLEKTGDKNNFHTAQKEKIIANELETISKDMKIKYPHLFKK